MEALLDWLEKHWGWLLPLLASCIKVKPMEVSPMVWLLRKIGNALTGDLRQQLSEMDSKIDRNEMDRIRWEVLDFANSCRNKKQHTKSEFEHIIDLNEKYEMLLTRTRTIYFPCDDLASFWASTFIFLAFPYLFAKNIVYFYFKTKKIVSKLLGNLTNLLAISSFDSFLQIKSQVLFQLS